MIEWYKKVVFENYANFSGRARRSEYWYYALASGIISIVLAIIDNVLGLTFGAGETGIIGSLYSLLVFLPGLAVMVRRLHDVGKSGWFLLIAFTVIGIFWLIYLSFKEGDQGTNEYGPDPKNDFDEINEIGTAEV
ncbi:MAG: DUF805 domain-containing protein [Bacteroidota bacterium]